MRAMTLPVLLAGMLGLAACSNMNQTEENVAGGAALGAGTGALLGGGVGDALLGGALGAGAGYVYDRAQDSDEAD